MLGDMVGVLPNSLRNDSTKNLRYQACITQRIKVVVAVVVYNYDV